VTSSGKRPARCRLSHPAAGTGGQAASAAGCPWRPAPSRKADLRKEYVHPGVPQTRLFAPVTEAETAITTLRDAIKDMCTRTGNPVEARPDDDEDAVDPRKGGFANATVISAGVTRETGLRICYVMFGQEYESEVTHPEEDPAPLMLHLLSKIKVPISAVRAYRGNEMIDEIVVTMRGSSIREIS
jgi:hypothetical protein